MTQATAPNPLIVSKQDIPSQTGVYLLDDANSLYQSITSGSWSDVSLSALGTGVDVVAAVTNPIATVVSYGANYLIEKVKPLNDALNWLAGDPAQIAAYAATWHNVSQAVGHGGQGMGTSLSQDTADWTGPAATGYRAVATETVTTIQAASTAAETLGKATSLIGDLVATVRTTIRDLVTQAMGQIVQNVLLALGVITIPLALMRVTSLVVSWMRRIADEVRKLTSSLAKLQPLMQQLAQLWSKIKQALGTRKEPQPNTAPWPTRQSHPNPTDFGRAWHQAMAELDRAAEGKYLVNGWRVWKVERTLGGKKRADFVMLRDNPKQIQVVDYFTGKVEPLSHIEKSWSYKNEPDIQALIKQGYEFLEPVSGSPNTLH